MQAKALIISLFLAASVAAAPVRSRDNKWCDSPTNKDSSNGMGSDNETDPALSASNANHNGIGNGNSLLSNNKNENENELLNDSFNFSYGADSRRISEDVVAALQSLTMTCTSSGEGVMSCTWTKS
ncbi:hypothetical protein O1611_g837 [Lasiodiplodia mahajangana]|uniref:Uncharacterized protein n=1 Tax=Lasiodiplodia mahajangana TaxID=1108764 RepID=A0ACC2JZE7_9PEZI|nr:hypothetical protein O1611_g837 [Lasiodiplodia mahajangana]